MMTIPKGYLIMKNPLKPEALNQLFLAAHSFNKFTDRVVTNETLAGLYNLLKWGPTAVNCQAARFVFVKSGAARERLLPCLQPGNVAKVEKAPVTVIVATDSRFYDNLPAQWAAYDARQPFVDNPALAEKAGFRNGTLGGAYLILAARALGLDCGPMSGFDNAKVDREFFPDGRFKSNFLVSLGYGAENGHYPRGPRLDFQEAVQII